MNLQAEQSRFGVGQVAPQLGSATPERSAPSATEVRPVLDPARQHSGEQASRQPRSAGRVGQRAGPGSRRARTTQPSANRGFTNAGSRDNANRNSPSTHGANGDTTGSRQTRSAPDWRRGAAACKRDGANSTHHLQRQPAYCRGQHWRAIAPSIRTIYVRALRKLLHIEPTSYRYCRAQRCSWAPDCSLGLNNLMRRPPLRARSTRPMGSPTPARGRSRTAIARRAAAPSASADERAPTPGLQIPGEAGPALLRL